jgi:outer membrane lipoprotein-sorting protein
LNGWLSAQARLTTWTAGFVQTRALKTLTQPLVSRGQVWFGAPNRFRWELGDPAQTIALRATNEMLVVYPRLKRIERYSLAADAAGPWKDALDLLEAGFPRDRQDLEARFKIARVVSTNGTHTLTLEPKSAGARRMMPKLGVVLDQGNFSLRATELSFADGSTLRNDFTNAVINPPLDDARFAFPVPADYTVTEPLKRR